MTRKTNEFFATETCGNRYTVSVLTESYDGIDGLEMYHAVKSSAEWGSYSGRRVERLFNGTYRLIQSGAVLTPELPL